MPDSAVGVDGPAGAGARAPSSLGGEVDAPLTVAALYATHRLGLVRLAVLLVDDLESAEDVVQDAFAGLHHGWGRLRDREAALGYLRRSVVNGARSVLRRRRTARAHVPSPAPDVASPEVDAVRAEEQRAVLAAVRALAPRQREVLVLRYWSGLDEGAIAATLGIARGTVKSTASRALDALEQTLERP